MASEQVTLGTTDLVTTERAIDNTISVTRADGMITVVVDFTIEGATVSATQELYRDTISDFTKNDNRLRVTYDTDAAGDGQYLEDIQPNTARVGPSACFVTMREADWQPSKNAIPMRLLYVARDYSSGASFAGTGGATEVTGLAETPGVTTTYSAGRIVGKSFLGVFVPESGSTGQANYEAARDTILSDILLTGADGDRDNASGLALVTENIEADGTDGSVTVLLQSKYVPFAFANAREAEIGINAALASRMPVAGGTLPLIITVTGKITFSDDVTNLRTAWETTKTEIESYVSSVTNESTLFLLSDLAPQYLPNQNAIQFTAQYQARNTTVISLTKTTTTQLAGNYVTTQDSDGYDTVQTTKALPAQRVTVAVSRVGTTRESLRRYITEPRDSRGTYIEVDRQEIEEEPEQTPGGTLYIQALTVAFERKRFKGNRTVAVLEANLG